MYGLGRISTEDNFYFNDGRGSVGQVVNGGNVVNSYSYDPFGNMTSGAITEGIAYGYNGEAYNGTTDLQYLRYRHYSPNIGRFNVIDSYLGDVLNPLSRNRYVYAENNPVMGIDPSGRWTDWNSKTTEDIRAGIKYLETAISHDPDPSSMKQDLATGLIYLEAREMSNEYLQNSAKALSYNEFEEKRYRIYNEELARRGLPYSNAPSTSNNSKPPSQDNSGKNDVSQVVSEVGSETQKCLDAGANIMSLYEAYKTKMLKGTIFNDHIKFKISIARNVAIVLSAIGVGIEVMQNVIINLENDAPWQRIVGDVLVDIALSSGAIWLGVKIGAAVGSAFPIVGTIGGALVGMLATSGIQLIVNHNPWFNKQDLKNAIYDFIT